MRLFLTRELHHVDKRTTPSPLILDFAPLIPQSTLMKIAILGAGALGCYYGARLLDSGHDVSFIMRSDCDYVSKHGLVIKSVDGNLDLPHIHAAQDPTLIGEVDLVIVSIKTTSNDQLAHLLPPLIGKETIVLTLQNGMGNGDAISAIIPPERIYIGLCFVCAMKTGAGEISHLSGGNIQIAPFIPSPHGTQEAATLADLFKNAHVSSKGYELAEQILWVKLIWNIPYNGLCLAKGGISVGELYKDPANIERVKKIMHEVILSARKRGYDVPDSLIDFHLERTKTMGEFIPSSAVDYNKGRPIEYDAIWGNPLAKAHAAGVSVPEWDQLDKEIRQRIGLDIHPS